MKKLILLSMWLFLGFTSIASAEQYLTLDQFLQSYFNVLLQNQHVPASYKYTQVKYKDIPGSGLYDKLQKAIYLNLFPNIPASLPLQNLMYQKQASAMIKQTTQLEIPYQEEKLVSTSWLSGALQLIQDRSASQSKATVVYIWGAQNYSLLENIYQTLQTEYLDANKMESKTLQYGAAKGMVESLGDEHTVFMPPTDASSFSDEIAGNYVGIGAYVEMKTPGQMIITAPLSDSPAQKWWLLAKDQVMQVDEHLVTQDVSLNTAVSRIKWPAGTSVTLIILRNGKQMKFTIQREKITLQNIQTQIYTSRTCYMAIHMFDLWVFSDFKSAMDQTFSSSKCTSYIFDLRNNPWWSLDEVVRMLDYIVPADQSSVVIKTKTYNETIVSNAISGTKITDKNIILLVNGSSASASEIFAGVVREYAPHAVMIGEKTYGKWSVQTLVEFTDGSLLKYTIAKRYTGKDRKNIDKIWYTPDILVADNSATTGDEMLDYALKYQFR